MEHYCPSLSRYKKESLKLHAKRWKRSPTLRIAMQMHQRRERWKRTQSDAGRLWSSILLALWILCMIGSFSGTVYGFTYYQSQLQKLQQVDHRVISQTTHIYASGAPGARAGPPMSARWCGSVSARRGSWSTALGEDGRHELSVGFAPGRAEADAR